MEKKPPAQEERKGAVASTNLDNIDQLNADQDLEYRKNFINPGMEVVMLSCKVSKFNKYNWQQERALVITQDHIYNFRQKKVKRAIQIAKLAGLTKSQHKTSKEFVIHVTGEHDYRLKSDQRDKIFNVIKVGFATKKKTNLPIYGIKNKDLRDFTTTEKDLEKGVSRIPFQLARIYEEDVIEEIEFSPTSGPTATLSEPLSILEDYTGVMEHRSQARNSMTSSAEKNPMFEQLNNEDPSEYQTLYRRQTLAEVNFGFDDFQMVHIIGKGTFGKVYLVQNKHTKALYAMKSIRKDIVIEHDSLENLHLEKMILNQVNHPFIISMEYVFIKSFRIYFIMDFIQGGELFKHLSESRRFTEERAKFYTAQIAMALGYLHKSRIIYRDLKPENILLNNDGYILLADFGLAKIKEVEGDEPNSFCGTPEYLSPEMIVGSGHDHTLDWWALGILLYEMIIGIPPFYNKNKHQMYYFIQHAPIRWPDREKHGLSVSDEAKDLITRLLEKDRKQRIGNKNDVEEVLGHPFFKDINMEKLLNKEIEPPFKPNIKSSVDLSNFDQKFVKLDVTESMLPEQSIQKIVEKKDAFEKFGFAAPDQ